MQTDKLLHQKNLGTFVKIFRNYNAEAVMYVLERLTLPNSLVSTRNQVSLARLCRVRSTCMSYLSFVFIQDSPDACCIYFKTTHLGLTTKHVCFALFSDCTAR